MKATKPAGMVPIVTVCAMLLILLFPSPLIAQMTSSKEYIYANGRLIVVEFGALAQPPDLNIRVAVAGTFVQGEPNAVYQITVSNIGAGPTTAAVTASVQLPNGLTGSSILGANWNCVQPIGPCTRGDVLPSGASFETINLIVAVPGDAPSSLTSMFTVQGGGETNTANDTAAMPTPVSAFSCDVNGDGATDGVDVHILINEALGVVSVSHDLNHDRVVNVADIQKNINAARGFGCPY